MHICNIIGNKGDFYKNSYRSDINDKDVLRKIVGTPKMYNFCKNNTFDTEILIDTGELKPKRFVGKMMKTNSVVLDFFDCMLKVLKIGLGYNILSNNFSIELECLEEIDGIDCCKINLISEGILHSLFFNIKNGNVILKEGVNYSYINKICPIGKFCNKIEDVISIVNDIVDLNGKVYSIIISKGVNKGSYFGITTRRKCNGFVTTTNEKNYGYNYCVAFLI